MRLPSSEYESLVTADSSIPLRDIFPDGIEFTIDDAGNIEVLTPPDSRYKVINGVVVRIDDPAAHTSS